MFNEEKTYSTPEQEIFLSQKGAEWPPKETKSSWFLLILIPALILGVGYFLFHYNDSPSVTHTSANDSHQWVPALATEDSFNTAVAEYNKTYNEALTQLTHDSNLIDTTNSLKIISDINSTIQPLIDSKNTDEIDNQRLHILQVLTSSEEKVQTLQMKIAASTNGTHTVAEAALDEASNNTISIVFTDGLPCGDKEGVAACVFESNPTSVTVVALYADKYNFDVWKQVMTHEYAHTLQYRNYQQFLSSNSYQVIFNSNIETYADCMAKVIIGDNYDSIYHSDCTPARLAAAKQAWSGIFP